MFAFDSKIQAAGLEIFPSKGIRISPAPHVPPLASKLKIVVD